MAHHLAVSKLFNVKSWVAVVTGGGTGIGLMCAQTLGKFGCTIHLLHESLIAPS